MQHFQSKYMASSDQSAPPPPPLPAALVPMSYSELVPRWSTDFGIFPIFIEAPPLRISDRRKSLLPRSDSTFAGSSSLRIAYAQACFDAEQCESAVQLEQAWRRVMSTRCDLEVQLAIEKSERRNTIAWVE